MKEGIGALDFLKSKLEIDFYGREEYLYGLEDRPQDMEVKDHIEAAKQEVGVERLRQYLQANGESIATIYLTDLPERIDVDILELKKCLQQAWKEGKIADINKLQIQRANFQNSNNIEKKIFSTLQDWVNRNSSTTIPLSTKQSIEQLPPVMVVFSRTSLASSVNNTRKIDAVVPHLHEQEAPKEFQISEKVASEYPSLVAKSVSVDAPVCDLREGLQMAAYWTQHPLCELRQAASQNIQRSESPSERIKYHLLNDPENYLDSEWAVGREEVWLNPETVDDVGRADLIFYHSQEHRYLIVEVKSDARGVREAFGQALVYRELLLNSHPSISKEQVELAIAAPDFQDTHEVLAEELDFDLLQVPIRI